jgi:hypothetical protein
MNRKIQSRQHLSAIDTSKRKTSYLTHVPMGGSVYVSTNGNTAAGYAAVTEFHGVRSIKRFNMAPHRTWTSKSAVLRHNPETTRPTDVEAKGLLVGIDEWFQEGRMREHIHVLDNQAVLHQISTPSRSKNDRHAFREYNHFTIYEIRRKLNRINYYEKNRWIIPSS